MLAQYRYKHLRDDIDVAHWKCLTRYWYSKAIYYNPGYGKLYHQIADTFDYTDVDEPGHESTKILQKLIHHLKSFQAEIPYTTYLSSILNPLFVITNSLDSDEVTIFIQLHGFAFNSITPEHEQFDPSLRDFLHLLKQPTRQAFNSRATHGLYMAICNISLLYKYSSKDSYLEFALKRQQHPHATGFELSLRLAFDTLSVTLNRAILDSSDLPNAMLHLYIWMVFTRHISSKDTVMRLIERYYPWLSIVAILKKLKGFFGNHELRNLQRQDPTLPEDYEIRGFFWTKGYFPEFYFDDLDTQIDIEDRSVELGMEYMHGIRIGRILSLEEELNGRGNWLKTHMGGNGCTI